MWRRRAVQRLTNEMTSNIGVRQPVQNYVRQHDIPMIQPSKRLDFPRIVDTRAPHAEACSKASGLTPRDPQRLSG